MEKNITVTKRHRTYRDPKMIMLIINTLCYMEAEGRKIIAKLDPEQNKDSLLKDVDLVILRKLIVYINDTISVLTSDEQFSIQNLESNAVARERARLYITRHPFAYENCTSLIEQGDKYYYAWYYGLLVVCVPHLTQFVTVNNMRNGYIISPGRFMGNIWAAKQNKKSSNKYVRPLAKLTCDIVALAPKIIPRFEPAYPLQKH